MNSPKATRSAIILTWQIQLVAWGLKDRAPESLRAATSSPSCTPCNPGQTRLCPPHAGPRKKDGLEYFFLNRFCGLRVLNGLKIKVYPSYAHMASILRPFLAHVVTFLHIVILLDKHDYRASHVLVDWVLLTWIWDVPPPCLGGR